MEYNAICRRPTFPGETLQHRILICKNWEILCHHVVIFGSILRNNRRRQSFVVTGNTTIVLLQVQSIIPEKRNRALMTMGWDEAFRWFWCQVGLVYLNVDSFYSNTNVWGRKIERNETKPCFLGLLLLVNGFRLFFRNFHLFATLELILRTSSARRSCRPKDLLELLVLPPPPHQAHERHGFHQMKGTSHPNLLNL